METTRIAQLLQPFFETERPSEELLHDVARYLELLLKWNARMNLTAIRDADNIVVRHFGESFFAARKLIGREESPKLADIGSGAGFPGVPIKMLRPRASVNLVEAQGRKAVFLREVIRELRLSGITVLHRRAETLIDEVTVELVTLRAVEAFQQTLPVAAQLLDRDGRLGLLVGEDQLGVAKKVLAGKWDIVAKIPLSDRRVVAAWTASAVPQQ